MKFTRFLTLGALSLSLSLSLLAGTAFAATKAEKQAEVVKATHSALEKFYKSKPELKTAVGKAPGYALFTTYGVSFLVGGEGGTGLVHDNKTQKNTFMKMAGASVGAQIGAAQNDVLVIFNTAAAMNEFIVKGWEGTGGVSAAAGAGDKSAGAGMGGSLNDTNQSFTLTKNGIQGGVAIGGAKAWKDDELN